MFWSNKSPLLTGIKYTELPDINVIGRDITPKNIGISDIVLPEPENDEILSGDTAEFTQAAKEQIEKPEPAPEPKPACPSLKEAGSFEAAGALSAAEAFKDKPDILSKNAQVLSRKETIEILQNFNLINSEMENIAAENEALFKTISADNSRQFYKAVNDNGIVKIISTNMKDGITSIKIFNTGIKKEEKKETQSRPAAPETPENIIGQPKSANSPQVQIYAFTGDEQLEQYDDGSALVTIEPNEFGGITKIEIDKDNRKIFESITRKNGSEETINYDKGVITQKSLSEKNGRVTDSYFVNGKLNQEIIKEKNKEIEKLYDNGIYKGRIEITPYKGKGSVGRISRYSAFDSNGKRIEASKLQWDDKHPQAGTPAEIYRRYWQRYFPNYNIDAVKNKDNTITIQARLKTQSIRLRINYDLTINPNGSFNKFSNIIYASESAGLNTDSNTNDAGLNPGSVNADYTNTAQPQAKMSEDTPQPRREVYTTGPYIRKTPRPVLRTPVLPPQIKYRKAGAAAQN